MNPVLIQVSFIILCVLGAAFYSGMETGVISIRRLRLRHRLRQGDRAAQKLAFFLEEPDRLLGTTLVGTNLCVVMVSIVSSRLSAPWGAAAQVISGLLISASLLIFSEYIPKAWFRAHPYYRCARFANALHISWIIFNPLGRGITWIAGLMIKGHQSGRNDLCSLASRGELKILTAEAELNGVLSSEERAMIQNTVELSEKTVAQICTRMDQVIVAPANCTVSEFMQLATKKEFSRYPVQQTGESTFLGIVDLLDVLTGHDGLDDSIMPFVREAVLIPRSTPADDVMPRLRLARQSMGLVTDESGAVGGVITTDDILNQIVLV
jgi:CBS domain containing-hemolysin-like protein